MKDTDYYFIKVKSPWTAKNKAEKAAQLAAERYDRKLMSDDRLEVFKNALHGEIHQINQDNKRCNTLQLGTWKGFMKDDEFFMGIEGVFVISVYKCRK